MHKHLRTSRQPQPGCSSSTSSSTSSRISTRSATGTITGHPKLLKEFFPVKKHRPSPHPAKASYGTMKDREVAVDQPYISEEDVRGRNPSNGASVSVKTRKSPSPAGSDASGRRSSKVAGKSHQDRSPSPASSDISNISRSSRSSRKQSNGASAKAVPVKGVCLVQPDFKQPPPCAVVDRAGKGSSGAISMIRRLSKDSTCSTESSPSTSDQQINRPKRQIIAPKNLEYTHAALSWKEQRELKKVLQISLKETKQGDDSGACPSDDADEGDLAKHIHKESSLGKKRGKKDELKLRMPGNAGPGGRKEFSHRGYGESGKNGSSGTSTESSSTSYLYKSQVRAQRKFAQGSRPVSPSTTPVKVKAAGANSSPKKLLLTRKAKTEDFLTFLCLRGSNILPPHLDFFSQSDVESLSSFPNTPRQSQDGSRPSTPAVTRGGNSRGGGGDKAHRDKHHSRPRPNESPDREISIDNSDLGVKPLGSHPGTCSRSTSQPTVVAGPSLTSSRSSSSRITATASAAATADGGGGGGGVRGKVTRAAAGRSEAVADVHSRSQHSTDSQSSSSWRLSAIRSTTSTSAKKLRALVKASRVRKSIGGADTGKYARQMKLRRGATQSSREAESLGSEESRQVQLPMAASHHRTSSSKRPHRAVASLAGPSHRDDVGESQHGVHVRRESHSTIRLRRESPEKYSVIKMTDHPRSSHRTSSHASRKSKHKHRHKHQRHSSSRALGARSLKLQKSGGQSEVASSPVRYSVVSGDSTGESVKGAGPKKIPSSAPRKPLTRSEYRKAMGWDDYDQQVSSSDTSGSTSRRDLTKQGHHDSQKSGHDRPGIPAAPGQSRYRTRASLQQEPEVAAGCVGGMGCHTPPLVKSDGSLEECTSGCGEESTVMAENPELVEGTGRLDVASQTSDTSSYTAEIEPSMLLDDSAVTSNSSEDVLPVVVSSPATEDVCLVTGTESPSVAMMQPLDVPEPAPDTITYHKDGIELEPNLEEGHGLEAQDCCAVDLSPVVPPGVASAPLIEPCDLPIMQTDVSSTELELMAKVSAPVDPYPGYTQSQEFGVPTYSQPVSDLTLSNMASASGDSASQVNLAATVNVDQLSYVSAVNVNVNVPITLITDHNYSQSLMSNALSNININGPSGIPPVVMDTTGATTGSGGPPQFVMLGNATQTPQQVVMTTAIQQTFTSLPAIVHACHQDLMSNSLQSSSMLPVCHSGFQQTYQPLGQHTPQPANFYGANTTPLPAAHSIASLTGLPMTLPAIPQSPAILMPPDHTLTSSQPPPTENTVQMQQNIQPPDVSPAKPNSKKSRDSGAGVRKKTEKSGLTSVRRVASVSPLKNVNPSSKKGLTQQLALLKSKAASRTARRSLAAGLLRGDADSDDDNNTGTLRSGSRQRGRPKGSKNKVKPNIVRLQKQTSGLKKKIVQRAKSRAVEAEKRRLRSTSKVNQSDVHELEVIEIDDDISSPELDAKKKQPKISASPIEAPRSKSKSREGRKDKNKSRSSSAKKRRAVEVVCVDDDDEDNCKPEKSPKLQETTPGRKARRSDRRAWEESSPVKAKTLRSSKSSYSDVSAQVESQLTSSPTEEEEEVTPRTMRSGSKSPQKPSRTLANATASPSRGTSVLDSPSRGSHKSKATLPKGLKTADTAPIMPKSSFRETFPSPNEPAKVVTVPTYHPSAEQFQDPIAYISSIRQDAESYGMCVIIPPEDWKPECKLSEDLRFTTQLQYIHKMHNRWGSNVQRLECIKKHLDSQGNSLEQSPSVSGIELDLPALSDAIQACGGLQHIINKSKWFKVAEALNLSKLAQDCSGRVCDIYCKYLLSYDMLSAEEKQRLEQQVQAEKQRHKKHLDLSCTAKGKSKTLSEFFRCSRNIQSMWLEEEPTAEEVESVYWDIVTDGSQHVAVQAAHIDSKTCGSAFPTKKDSPYSKHGWNFNILQHNSGSLLKYVGQISGLTLPMLHIGMLMSTSCWARDPHSLPYVSYLHTGADVVWYCIPKSEQQQLKATMEKLVPDLIDAESSIWLPEDSVMISPELLMQHGLSLCRTVQQQGQFVVVFPEAFTASIGCGYNISESLHFATPDWVPLGCKAAQMLYDSGEPDLFSMERLMYKLARSDKTTNEVLRLLLPHFKLFIDQEIRLRRQLKEAGLKNTEKISHTDNVAIVQGKRKRSSSFSSDEENRCEASRKICYFSMVVNESEGVVYSLEHGLTHVQKKKNLKNCKLVYRFTERNLQALLVSVRSRLAASNTPAKKHSHRSHKSKLRHAASTS